MTGHCGADVGVVSDPEVELQAAYVAAVEGQTVRWQGATVPPRGLWQALESPDRRIRERAWRLQSQRWLADGAKIEGMWHSLVHLRMEQAASAGAEGYADLRRQELGYPPTPPGTARRAHLAVEEFVTSVLVRLHERRRRQLGIRTIRPWDLMTAPPGFPVTPIFQTEAEVVDAMCAALHGVSSPVSSENFPPKRSAEAFTSDAEVEESVGRYARAMLNQPNTASEDVVATALKLLVLQGRTLVEAGVRIGPDIARARIRHLERTLFDWAYAAMIDSFEEWTYANPAEALHAETTGSTWASIWLRFLPAVDWAGLDAELAGEWQRHGPLFLRPGESVARMASEVALIGDWIEVTDADEWFHTHITSGRSHGGRYQPALEIDDMDLLDVARWMEDAIEDLER